MTLCSRGTPLKHMLYAALQQNGRCARYRPVMHRPTIQNTSQIHPAEVRHLSTRTVLQDLGEMGAGRSPVTVTLADNPGIIVCHHPPNKVGIL